MAEKTKIQWSEATWNAVTGCTRVSDGCTNCYAYRLHDQRYAANRRVAREQGYTSAEEARVFETDALPKVLPMPEQYDRPFSMVQLLPDRLEDPLHWRKPRHVFVDSMGDLFHPDVPDAYLDRVFAVMALSPQHTYQVLTKRPERMRQYMASLVEDGPDRLANAADRQFGGDEAGVHLLNWTNGWSRPRGMPDDGNPLDGTQPRWPLPNVWLGTSVEDQPSADARIPLLLQTPAAVRFLSCEPLLGRVTLTDIDCFRPKWEGEQWEQQPVRPGHMEGLHWVIVGGESGPRARVCDLEWIRDLVRQCQAARVPAFVKQLGSKPSIGYVETDAGTDEFVPDVVKLKHGHGGDPSEWPADLQVREWPEVTA